ncbi:MAG: hypothetical protein ACFE8N_09940, partial [Promethearchaeota archaeon]
MRNSNDNELERLRIKILDAIRTSKRFWMTYREKTFGVASILNLVYKKSFIEVLFFTNRDVVERGVPLLKIYTPIENELDFEDILTNPDFDEDGLVSPLKIIERMRKLIRREFQNHLSLLEKEVEFIEDKYENSALDIPYSREVRFYFSNLVIELIINFEKYPLPPTFKFSKTLSNIISEREFSNQSIIKDWNEDNPPHIYQIIEQLSSIISFRLKVDPLIENSQHLMLKSVSISKNLENISFRIHRGKSLGIIYEPNLERRSYQEGEILNLFNAIAGKNSEFSGNINIFGKDIQSLPSHDRNRIFIFPETYDSQSLNMKIKKAIEQKVDIQEFQDSQKSKLKRLNKFTKEVLNNIGLGNRLNEKLSDLKA